MLQYYNCCSIPVLLAATPTRFQNIDKSNMLDLRKVLFRVSFSSITGFRDISTTNDPINLISAPLEPHHQGQHIYILITWGTDEVRRGGTIFPFQRDSQKFAISHFSDKWGESPTHT